jgi:hypothetical protein
MLHTGLTAVKHSFDHYGRRLYHREAVHSNVSFCLKLVNADEMSNRISDSRHNEFHDVNYSSSS